MSGEVMARVLTMLRQVLKPAWNLVVRRPVLVTFQVNLRCNSACGYCDLPLNVGRYELSRDEIRRVFAGLYRDYALGALADRNFTQQF